MCRMPFVTCNVSCVTCHVSMGAQWRVQTGHLKLSFFVFLCLFLYSFSTSCCQKLYIFCVTVFHFICFHSFFSSILSNLFCFFYCCFLFCKLKYFLLVKFVNKTWLVYQNLYWIILFAIIFLVLQSLFYCKRTSVNKRNCKRKVLNKMYCDQIWKFQGWKQKNDRVHFNFRYQVWKKPKINRVLKEIWIPDIIQTDKIQKNKCKNKKNGGRDSNFIYKTYKDKIWKTNCKLKKNGGGDLVCCN